MNEFFRKPIVKTLMLKGQEGQSIKGITKTGTDGFVDTYTITLTDGTTSTFTVTNGKEISSIDKTGTSGLVDTYTITFNDGTTSTFTVTNGKGISNISKTGTSGFVDTYTITFNDGTTSTFTVTNGELKMDLLWTNANPYSNFIAQTLNIGVKKYKFIIIVVEPVNGNLENFMTYLFVTSIKDNRINTTYYSGRNTDSRGFVIEDDYLEIGDSTTEGTTNNSVLIPYQIFGVK